MKKQLIGTCAVMTMAMVMLTGCSSSNKSDSEGQKSTTTPVVTESVEQTTTANTITLSDVKYSTITEVYDWGPAISKVVLDMTTTVDGSCLSTDTFSVKSIRSYYDLNMETFQLNDELTVSEADRNVTNIYVSDAEGNPTANGTYVTIEMEVGPDLTAGSPFNYNFISSFNSFVDTSYVIGLNDGKELVDVNGADIEFQETTADGYTDDHILVADDFDTTGTFTYSGENEINLTYASYIPTTASSEQGANPLIIWLHGAGEGGTDARINIIGNKVVNLASDEIQSLFGETGAYILAPQSPTMWMDYDGNLTYTNSVDGSNGESYYTEALKALIDNYVSEHPEIDTNRIYIGGCSNGGYMTVNMVTTYDDYFAAAFPICEAFSDSWLTDEKLAAISDLPIWLTHAKTDATVQIYEGTAISYVPYEFEFTLDDNGNQSPINDYSNALYDRLVNAGNDNVHYSLFEKVEDPTGLYFKEDGVTPYEYMGHYSWVYALNNQCVENIDGSDVTLFGWLANQSLNKAE